MRQLLGDPLLDGCGSHISDEVAKYDGANDSLPCLGIEEAKVEQDAGQENDQQRDDELATHESIVLLNGLFHDHTPVDPKPPVPRLVSES